MIALPGGSGRGIGLGYRRAPFRLGDYFMAVVLAAARYSRIGFSLYFAVRARSVRVPGGSKFHLEPGTIHPCWNLTGT